MLNNRIGMTYVQIADRQYVQDFEYKGNNGLMSFSEYSNYYKVMKNNQATLPALSPQDIRDEITNATPRDDGTGKPLKMSSIIDIWIRINGILSFTPVRVVSDSDIDQQLILTCQLPKIERIIVHKPGKKKSVIVQMNDKARIPLMVTGPHRTLKAQALIDTGATLNCMSKTMFLAMGYKLSDLHETEDLMQAGEVPLKACGISEPIPLRIKGELFWVSFTVTEKLLSPIILGTNFQQSNDAAVLWRTNTLELTPNGRKVIARNEVYDERGKEYLAHFRSDHQFEAADGAVMKLALDINQHQRRQLEGRQVIVLPMNRTMGRTQKDRQKQISRAIGTGRTIATIKDGQVLAPVFNAHESARIWDAPDRSWHVSFPYVPNTR